MKRETAMDHRHLGILCHRLGDPDAGDASTFARRLELAVEVGLPWTVMLAARSMATRRWSAPIPRWRARLLGNTEAVSELFGYLPTPDERELVDGHRCRCDRRHRRQGRRGGHGRRLPDSPAPTSPTLFDV